MAKDFLNLKTDQKKLQKLILCGGILLTVMLGIQAVCDRQLPNGNELLKKKAGEGAYEQTVMAQLQEKEVLVTVAVEEQLFTREEAETMLQQAETVLDELLKAQNESLSKVETDLYFADSLPDLYVEVEWTDKLPGYFYSDGTFREDVELSAPVEQKVSAILSCQQYVRDYEAVLTIYPKERTLEEQLLEQTKEDFRAVRLPEKYQDQQITWKKPMDLTFVYVGILTLTAVVFLYIGNARDEKQIKKQRMEALDKDYAQVVSKFTMLLSAGLSVRNAWERIVYLNKETDRPVYIEMNISVQELQKGVSELEVYERFGVRVGLVHYKKLMALFISDKKRGSMNLLEAMNGEMLQAWEEQKRRTRQQGEKTGTKLLLPMMGMLAVVFMMIMIPAFLSFQL